MPNEEINCEDCMFTSSILCSIASPPVLALNTCFQVDLSADKNDVGNCMFVKTDCPFTVKFNFPISFIVISTEAS